MGAISKKYVTAGVAVVAVAAIAIALVYSQRKKSTYNALVSSAADGVNRVIGGAPLDPTVWEENRRYLVHLSGGCGATLISRRAVLTAAHCFDNEGEYSPNDSIDFNRYAQDDNGGVTTIPLCQTEFNTCSDDISLAYAIRHSAWDSDTFENDVALIILPEGLQITPSMSPVRLNRNHDVPKVGQELEAFGWGAIDCAPEASYPNEIQTGTLKYLTNQECNDLWGNITDDMLCARTDSANGVAVGGGDSGGPLVIVQESGETLQVGVVSFGGAGGDDGTTTFPDAPDGFARVSFLFDWIQDTVCEEVPRDEVFCRRSKAAKNTKQGKRV